MLLIGEVAATISSLKLLGDVVVKMKESTEKRHLMTAFQDVQDKVIALQSLVMSTRESESAAKERVTELEQECMRLKNWQAEAERYVMTQISSGVFAYTPKPGMQGSDPPHYLCATCFQNSKKSILQFYDLHPQSRMVRDKGYECHSCHSKFKVT